MASADQDPYYLAEQEVASSVRGLMSLHEKWKNLIFNTNTYTDKEFRWASRELRKLIATLTENIDDIHDTIKICEKFPAKYNISTDEIEKRKSFVRDVRAKINEVNRDFEDPQYNRKIEDDKSKELLSNERRTNIEKSSRFEGLRRAHEEDNNDFLRENAQMQQKLIQQQDEGFDMLHEQVRDLGEMSKVMESELKLEAGILDRLEHRAMKSSATLASVMRKLDRFMEQTSSKLQWTIIAILAIIFIILVVLSTTILKKA